MSDRRAAARLLGGLGPIFPTIKTVIADAGHQSRKLASLIKAEGYELRIVKRRKRAFEVVGLTWIVERVLVQFPINGCSLWQNDFLGSMPPRSPPRALERSLFFGQRSEVELVFLDLLC